MSTVADEVAAPPRTLLRPAAALVQLSAAFALLLGTIAFVLVTQNASGGQAYVVAWAGAAMAAIVVGGLMPRGGLVAVLAAASIVAVFGAVIIALPADTLRSLLRILPASDVSMISNVLRIAAIVMFAAAALSLASIPQARRYHHALREAEANEAQASGSGTGVQISTPRIPSTRPAAPPPPPAPPALVGVPPPQIGASWNVGAPPPLRRPGEDARSAPGGATMPGSAGTTMPGWEPARGPIRTYTTMQLRAPEVEAASRRRVYFAIGGLAVGVGVGIGILVSSMTVPREIDDAAASSPRADRVTPGSDARSGSAGPASTVATMPTAQNAVTAPPIAAPPIPVQDHLETQHGLLAKADAHALANLATPTVIGWGIGADDVIDGRESYEAVLLELLADTPPDGFRVESRSVTIGGLGRHAWIAEELDLGTGDGRRRLAVTQLCAFAQGTWNTIAVHWAIPVADEIAERRAVLGTMPRLTPVTDLAQGGDQLGAVVRAMFASRTAFAAARSEREDAFNFGSAPGERVLGGARIRSLFGKLRAELGLRGGIRAIADDRVAAAALTVDFTHRTKAATEITQAFRVLAILVQEGDRWMIVQTQFSHPGPL